MSHSGILERLSAGPVLGAEGYLFELERRGYIKAGPYVPEVVLDFPQALRQLHREFLRAGSEVMVAFTYYAHREKLQAVGRTMDLESMNRQALRIARETAAEENALVAGNLSNTWRYDSDDPESSAAVIFPMFEEQVRWMKQEGAAFVIAETFDFLGEALLALDSIKKHGLPAMVTFSPKHDRTFDGFGWDEACRRLEQEGADIVGFNCGMGPDTLYPLLEKTRPRITCYLAAQPVPYRTTPEQPYFQKLQEPGRGCAFPLALDSFLHSRFEMADFTVKAREMGVDYIGACCGAGPHHIRAMAEALGRKVPASRYSPELSLHPVLGTGHTYCESD
jgi:betaine-homocysteine S-methyltransferase